MAGMCARKAANAATTRPCLPCLQFLKQPPIALQPKHEGNVLQGRARRPLAQII